MVNDDIIMAQKIIANSFNNIGRDECYHLNSFIYKNTNEKINDYLTYLKNKKRVLSVISSGDQILNSVLCGTKEIDGYDISRFPKYFLELKIAAIKTLSSNEYISFFMGKENKDEFSDETYDYIRENLKGDYLKFWDNLFNFYDGYEIYHSMLFSNEVFSVSSQIKNNKFLQGKNYEELKSKLSDIKIKYYTSDITSLIKKLNKKYDLINLSSIIYYGKMNNYDYYKKFINVLSLNDNGIALTYLYLITNDMKEKLDYKNFTLDIFENKKTGVLIYQKK